MDSNAKEFWHVVRPSKRPFVPNKGKTYSYIPELTTVLPIENLPKARVFGRVRNRPPRERDRTGLSREQISFWFAGYPKTRAATSSLGPIASILVFGYESALPPRTDIVS